MFKPDSYENVLAAGIQPIAKRFLMAKLLFTGEVFMHPGRWEGNFARSVRGHSGTKKTLRNCM